MEDAYVISESLAKETTTDTIKEVFVLVPPETKVLKLENEIGKETNLNDIFPIFRKLSWILFDFCSKYIKDEMLSITDTTNEKKIKLYRNIIKDSFSNISEIETTLNGIKYFIYKIIKILFAKYYTICSITQTKYIKIT